MTVQDLLDECLVRLNSDTDEFAYSELLSYFQDILDGIYQELALRRCHRLLKSLSISATPTSLPADFFMIHKVVYVNDDGDPDSMDKILPEDADSLDSDDDPCYYVMGDSLYIAPSVPTTCTLYYFFRSTVTTSSDVPFEGIWAPTLKQMIVKLATMRIEGKTPDIDQIASYFSTLATRIMTYTEGRPDSVGVDNDAF